MLSSLYASILGFLLDFVIGGLQGKFHPVRMTGSLLAVLERQFRGRFPDTDQGRLMGGLFLTWFVSLAAFLISYFLLMLIFRLSPLAAFFLESFLFCFTFSLKAVKVGTVKIVDLLKKSSLEESRKALSGITATDTGSFSREELIKATVEVIAKNTTDGIVAPMFFMIIGGAPFALFYKAVNIMHSMAACKNETSMAFGRYAAKLDNILKYYPARIAANMLIFAAHILKGTDGKNAGRIYARDRLKHSCGSSAHTAAAYAGALRIGLAGDSSFGKRKEKELIGDNLAEISAEMIFTANKLMYMTAGITILLLGAIKFGIIYLFFLQQ